MKTIVKWMLDWAGKWLADRYQLTRPRDAQAFKWCCDCGQFEICDGQVTVVRCRCNRRPPRPLHPPLKIRTPNGESNDAAG